MVPKKFPISSKFLSLILRHKPYLIGLRLDENGWADVDELIEKVRATGKDLDLNTLEHIVETNDKKRFSFNEDQTKIRANQGHSIGVDLGLKPQVPPDLLYHGTAEKNISSILNIGLHKRNRHHVHLSSNEETAMQVGKRHGKPVIFEVAAGNMFRKGFIFYLSANGVWLVDAVPAEFLELQN